MFNWLFRKKEVEKIKEETKQGFNSVKKDISSISDWIRYLDSEKNQNKKDIEEVKEYLSSVKEEIEGLKNVFSMIEESKKNSLFKTGKQLSKQQTGVYPVQTPVQTAVQTPNLDQFSLTERAIIWTLLNSDMKLSYDDIAAILGKEKSTIRGQINSIKQKSEGLLEEDIEKNGKKRVYMPEKNKEKLFKKTKVRVNKEKKDKKKQKASYYG